MMRGIAAFRLSYGPWWRIGHVFANNLPQLAEGVPPLVAVAVLLFTGPFFLSSDFIARTLSDKTKFSGRARLFSPFRYLVRLILPSWPCSRARF